MTCAAIIAIKSTPAAKSRLRETLCAALHMQLVQTMLHQVITAVSTAQQIDEVVLVSPEHRDGSFWPRQLLDTAQDLNAAFALGIRDATLRGHDSVLLVPADLALLDAASIDTFIDCGRAAGIAIASDASGVGTNALWFSLKFELGLAFGADSFARHRAECRRLGLEAALVQNSRLSLDVDTAIDLEQLRESAQYEFLAARERCVA